MTASDSRLKLALATLAGAAALHLVLAACGHSSSNNAQCQTSSCGGGSAQGGPGLAPSGAVMAFAGSAAPEGWLICDGSSVSRTQYASLFAAIGTAHGSGDGTTTFQLPDYRGRFLRGVDDGQKRDPDALARTAAAPGGNAGDAVGSIEGDANAPHVHPVMATRGAWGRRSTGRTRAARRPPTARRC
jgi:phage-related tail fiber protein